MNKLQHLNDASESDAKELLEPFVERAPQVAEQLAKRRPFSCFEDIIQAIKEELQQLSEPERIQLFCAHPELAPDNPLTMTKESQQEQGRLDLTAGKNEMTERLDHLNSTYRSRFGFPFITALVRHDAIESVFEEFEQRLTADRNSEIEFALGQVATVSAARVKSAFTGESNHAVEASTAHRQAG